MTESSVLLLTSHYPYDSGEEFIEAEIEHLAARFDRVLIAPLSVGPSSALTRELPPNASTVLPASGTRSGSASRDLLRFLARHPLRAARSLGRALRDGGLSRFSADARFDLLASLLADGLLPGIAAAVGPDGPSIVYSYWLHTQARVAVELKRRLGSADLPLVSRGHGGDIYAEAQPNGYLPQRERVLQAMNRIFTVSENGAEYLAGRYPDTAARIGVRHLGVGAANNPGNATVDAGLVVTCSWVRPLKRLDLLAAGLGRAQARRPGLRWVHYGSGPHADVEALLRRAEAELSPGSFEFAGALSNSELRARYSERAGTVFVNVSETEGVPVSIMEALAQGLPVIATDVGGSSELISPDTGMFDGLLPAHPSPEEIADRILVLLDAGPERYRAYAEASLNHWAEAWSSDRNYRAFAAELRSIAEAPSLTHTIGRDAR